MTILFNIHIFLISDENLFQQNFHFSNEFIILAMIRRKAKIRRNWLKQVLKILTRHETKAYFALFAEIKTNINEMTEAEKQAKAVNLK